MAGGVLKSTGESPDDRSGSAHRDDLPIRALIVESEPNLGRIWQRHLRRMGVMAFRAESQAAAVELLCDQAFDVIVLDLVLPGGSALAVADFANYRQPEAKVIFVTNTSFFSDGSIFRHAANACALLNSAAPPADLAALVEHSGTTAKAL